MSLQNEKSKAIVFPPCKKLFLDHRKAHDIGIYFIHFLAPFDPLFHKQQQQTHYDDDVEHFAPQAAAASPIAVEQSWGVTMKAYCCIDVCRK